MEASDLTQLSEDLIHRLGTGGDLEGMISAEMYPQNNLYIDEDDNEPDDVIILHMDIREPLSTLRKLLEQKTGVALNGYKFWLQDAQELEPHKNLVDQCVKGEGLVQINVQIQTIVQRINIVDVLKPTEAALAALAAEEAQKSSKSSEESLQDEDSKDSDNTKRALDLKTNSKPTSAEKPCLNWVLDSKFKREQARLKIPEDPNDWTVAQVTHWFQWAVRQFDLVNINLSDWAITGAQLCALTHEEFRKKLPHDPGNVFWTHLQLLKECKFVSVVHNIAEISPHHSRFSAAKSEDSQKELKIMRKPSIYGVKNYSPWHGDVSPHTAATTYSTHGVGSGNNGQVQLWQFLLEILTDRQHSDIIKWVGTEGEFKLSDPEKVARLWGVKKNKPAMNYEKLSRALRYYYDGDMISKVSGKRFAYKFDCDLKLLIGYNAAELSALVNERTFLAESHLMEHSRAKMDEE